jgi:hypothetical protein
MVETASGKFHLWYRHDGELRRPRPYDDGLPLDVLGAGNAIAPATTTARGQYRFIRGGLDDIRRLVPMRNNEQFKHRKGWKPETTKAETIGEVSDAPQKIREGRRNEELFRSCMRYANRCKHLNDLLVYAKRFNEAHMMPALSDAEVMQTAANAWRYEDRGENWFSRPGGAVSIPRDKFERLSENMDALWLLLKLRSLHWLTERFAVANAMAGSLGWDLQRFKAARRYLVECGELRVLHQGGRGPRRRPSGHRNRKRAAVRRGASTHGGFQP